MELTSADEQIMSALTPGEFCGTLWRGKMEGQTVRRNDLRKAAEQLAQRLSAEWHLIPYRYGMKGTMPVGNESVALDGARGVSGFHVSGKPYHLTSGVAECYIEENKPDAKRIDVRDRAVIETDNWGPIRITRRKIKTTLREQLGALLAFLGSPGDEEFSIRTFEGPRTVMSLVRLCSEGDEGAEEELFNMGDAARRELIERLSDRKARKHHGTIAWILTTVLPSAEARAAVERLIEVETNGEAKAAYLAMLGNKDFA